MLYVCKLHVPKAHTTSNKNHDRIKQSTTNNDYKKSSLTKYHQNNETDELVNQWGSKIPHLICLTEHLLSNTEISYVIINSCSLGASFL